MKDVVDRIDAWLEGDLSGDADKTLRDARNEIIALRAKLEYAESRFCSLPRLFRQPDWMPPVYVPDLGPICRVSETGTGTGT